jgi:hypothetical protein
MLNLCLLLAVGVPAPQNPDGFITRKFDYGQVDIVDIVDIVYPVPTDGSLRLVDFHVVDMNGMPHMIRLNMMDEWRIFNHEDNLLYHRSSLRNLSWEGRKRLIIHRDRRNNIKSIEMR